MREFLSCIHILWLIDVYIDERIVFLYPLHQGKRFWEMVERVKKDEIDDPCSWDIELGKHVERNQAAKPKSGRLIESRERYGTPS